MIQRSWVQVLAMRHCIVAFKQATNTSVLLSSSSITWYREGNCRSGSTLATCHRLSGISSYGLMAIGRQMNTMPVPTLGIKPFYRTVLMICPLIHRIIIALLLSTSGDRVIITVVTLHHTPLTEVRPDTINNYH